MPRQAWGAAVQNREEQHRLKRQVVLHAAARTFSQKGYEQTTLGDIAEELHIAKPTLYYYFKGKDEILFEIQRLAIAAITEDPDPPGMPALERLDRFVRRYLKMITSDFGACLITTPRQAFGAETATRLVAAVKPVDRMLREIIVAGQAEGVFAASDARISAALIFGGLNWVPRWYRPDGAINFETLTESTSLSVRRSLTE